MDIHYNNSLELNHTTGVVRTNRPQTNNQFIISYHSWLQGYKTSKNVAVVAYAATKGKGGMFDKVAEANHKNGLHKTKTWSQLILPLIESSSA